jgi:membrane dipeptidase
MSKGFESSCVITCPSPKCHPIPIDHVVKFVGPDHIGIGSDWDGISAVPAGLEDMSKTPSLTARLLQRGYSERDVKKILGGNFLRVMRQVIGR